MTASTQNVPEMPQSQPRIYRPQQWPGERRHPTQWDVHDASESPAAAFLERFRVALLHIEGEGVEEDLLLDSEADVMDTADMGASMYTYPVMMLSEVPTLPPDGTLAQLQASFFNSFDRHVFVSSVSVENWCSVRQPLYFQLTLACLASVTSTEIGDLNLMGTHRAKLSADLFVAGVNIWTAMLEVDNRESRLCEAVIAAALLCTYGTLSRDSSYVRKVSGILCNLATMSRRTHIIDGYSPVYASTRLPEKAFGVKSSLVGYLILIDTVYAVHCGRLPNISTSELYIKMPTSNHHFRTVYNSMIHGYAVPTDVKGREDALLLLVALLSDIIYMQHCTRFSVNEDTKDAPLRNPFVPLSMQSEHCRLTAEISAALSRWEQHFKRQVEKDIVALYHFTNLQLHCPDLASLSQTATMPTGTSASKEPYEVTDRALNLAWLILDQCHGIPEEQRLSIWLPVVLFQSAMVVWQKWRPTATKRRYGALSVLTVFGNEIGNLPWSCCKEMKETLDRLAAS